MKGQQVWLEQGRPCPVLRGHSPSGSPVLLLGQETRRLGAGSGPSWVPVIQKWNHIHNSQAKKNKVPLFKSHEKLGGWKRKILALRIVHWIPGDRSDPGGDPGVGLETHLSYIHDWKDVKYSFKRLFSYQHLGSVTPDRLKGKETATDGLQKGS